MTQSIDLQEIEKKAWTSYFQDGMWDMFFGMMMLVGAIRTYTGNPYTTLLIFVAVGGMVAGKKLITTPRLGRVKFGPERQKKRTELILGLVISVFVTSTVLMVLFPDFSVLVRSVLMFILITFIFSMVAYYMEFKRLYIYGILIAATFGAGELLDQPLPAIAYAIPGTIMMAIGMGLFIRFLRKYPSLKTKEVFNDTRR